MWQINCKPNGCGSEVFEITTSYGARSCSSASIPITNLESDCLRPSDRANQTGNKNMSPTHIRGLLNITTWLLALASLSLVSQCILPTGYLGQAGARDTLPGRDSPPHYFNNGLVLEGRGLDTFPRYCSGGVLPSSRLRVRARVPALRLE
ncbi:uncharacterized protein N7459_003510 [Penicillium hispanicum]|uniref:uncharacterized protein n=1 Tax=Penicillium hispanicum TaxID=1080232 RepID=UPI002540F4FA|nr:uncharacterized protein N7459_003510 [Penicillium hispanicum]KAJ5587745.1 hypothetical protein N7459_003510 [Penicillium hispanicum]